MIIFEFLTLEVRNEMRNHERKSSRILESFMMNKNGIGSIVEKIRISEGIIYVV